MNRDDALAHVAPPVHAGMPATHVPVMPSLNISERKLLLAVVDLVLLIAVSALLTHVVRGPGGMPIVTLAACAVWLALGQVAGLYELTVSARPRSLLPAMAKTVLGTSIVLIAFFYLWPFAIGREKLLALELCAPVALIVWRFGYMQLLGAVHFQRRVLVVGADDTAITLLRAISGREGHGIVVTGLISDTAVVGDRREGVPILGTSRDLWEHAMLHRVEEVVIADSRPSRELLNHLVRGCYVRGIAITLMPNLYEEVTGQIPVDYMEPEWLSSVILHRPGGRLYWVAKRAVEVLSSLLGIVLTAPVMLFVALLVKLTSPGPVFYRQRRLGLHGQPFEIIKFRTMREDAEAHGQAIWATRNDPRTTPIGRWLRRSHLDELPQLFLVLEGKMSLVGPRPERPEFAHELEQAIPLYAARHSVRPGVTGWAQVSYPYGSSVEDALAKLRYDLYYVKHASVLLDITIVLQTMARVFGLRGR